MRRFLIFPALALAVAAIGSPGLVKSARLLFLFVGLGAVSWLTMARIVRGQVLSLRQRPFVEASRALGAGAGRILARHIIPNTFGVVIVYLTLTVPAIILYESFLSYLGLGIQPPMASWGSLIAEGADQMNPIRIYWWLIACPGGLRTMFIRFPWTVALASLIAAVSMSSFAADEHAPNVTATLHGHTESVYAIAVLPDSFGDPPDDLAV